MNVATKRICRTCPMVVSEGASQCRPCAARSAAVSSAVKPDVAPAPRVGKPEPRTCETDGHRACSHYMAILEPVRKWIEDLEWCAICGAETPQDAPGGSPVPHLDGCALLALIGPAEDREV